MQGLIIKSSYIKPGGGGAESYMNYIATRDGVEVLSGGGQSEGQTGKQYMRYIAERPRSHGLFSNSPNVSLKETVEEVSDHPAPVWTLICSLKREDAARLGYDSAASWRRLIIAHQSELAEAMKIPPSQFRWCAAYHDEKHHPHIHMMVWSADPKRGYLTEQGIEIIHSKLTNDIFQDELLHLYQRKDISYREVVAAARETMRELIHQMESSFCENSEIESKIETLAEMLRDTPGKKVYGYLKKPVKAQVDAIVDELAQLPEVAECYEVWNRLRDEVEGYYKDRPREWLPLSRQKEFKAIQNAVIREAENIRLSVVTFEDERMADEIEEDSETVDSSKQTVWQLAWEYNDAKALLDDDTASETEKEEAVHMLEQLWDCGFAVAAYQLGKCWRDGLGVLPADEKAELWFRRSAEAGNDFSQYALGKLLQGQKRIGEAVAWYKKAAAQGNQYAAYRLGKLYVTGEDIPKDVSKALEYLTASARQGNQYAQYTLGKLYLMGEDVKRDWEKAYEWFCRAADQGNEYAEFFLERFDQIRKPNVLISTTRLLHHMGQIFRQNSVPPAAPAGQRIDRKLRRQIQQKKIAMGHKPNDHEEDQQGGMTMGGM